MCFNCAGILCSLDPMPKTIFALKEAVSRERRLRDRRWGKADGRVFVYERRVGERRSDREVFPSPHPAPIDDDMIIEVSIDFDAELAPEPEDITQIRELVRELRPVELGA